MVRRGVVMATALTCTEFAGFRCLRPGSMEASKLELPVVRTNEAERATFRFFSQSRFLFFPYLFFLWNRIRTFG